MTVHVPATVDDAVARLAETPGAVVLAGGTDLMVEINDGRLRPAAAVVAVNRIPELRSWRHRPGGPGEPDSSTSDSSTSDSSTPDSLTLGAAVTYAELMQTPLASLAPALAEASRTVGSPQIRNAGTLGGNLGTASPAGDGLPVLAALDAVATIASVRGRRSMPVRELLIGAKQTALQPGDLIVDVTIPVVPGWQGYAKVGVRNSMVIAIAAACLVLDEDRQAVALSLGSVAPTVVRAPAAEALLAAAFDWSTWHVTDEALDEFGRLAAEAASPISDHRATAEYRRHACAVLARRLVRRAMRERIGAAA